MDVLQSGLALWGREIYQDLRASGVDGLIVPDLPPEEAQTLCRSPGAVG